MNFYFVRHGESEANVQRIISNRRLPHGLTARGRAQAEQLAAELSDARPTQIFSSPILRARQTAEILAAHFALPVSVTDALREYDCGILEGRGDETSWAHHRQQFENWVAHERWDSCTAGGESFNAIRARFAPFIENLVRREPRTANLVLVGHGGIFILMLPLILANVSHALALAQPFRNTAYVRAETRADHLVCIEWCGLPL